MDFGHSLKISGSSTEGLKFPRKFIGKVYKGLARTEPVLDTQQLKQGQL